MQLTGKISSGKKTGYLKGCFSLSRTIGLLILVLYGFLGSMPVRAQTFPYNGTLHGSTYHWSFMDRIQLFDRSHAYGNGTYDRGFRAVITPLTPREYELDMFTYAYSFADDFVWQREGSGMRLNFGSYTKQSLAVTNHLTQDITFSDRSSIRLNALLQQDGRANRAYFEFDYMHRLGENHILKVAHNITERKQDMDITFGYAFRHDEVGQFSLDFTFQNYLNNLVNNIGEKTTRRNRDSLENDQRNRPLYFFARYTSKPERIWYLDVSWGFQPMARLNSISFNDPDYLIRQQENLMLFNSSLSFNLGKIVAGAFHYRDFTHMSRSSDIGNPFQGQYETNQGLLRTGLFAYGRYGRFQPEFRLSSESYQDEQTGTDFSYSSIGEAFDWHEKRLMISLGTSFDIIRDKFRVTLRYLSIDRDITGSDLGIYNRIYRIELFDKDDKRLTLSFQCRPHERLFFEIGAGYDVDGDLIEATGQQRRFDKAFGKLAIQF